MKFYTSISLVIALYTLLLFPSVLLVFQVFLVIDGLFGGVDGQAINILMNCLILIIPAVIVVMLSYFKGYFTFSGFNVGSFKYGLLSVSLGHFGLAAIGYVLMHASQLAGWISIPFVIWCNIFYSIGFIIITGKIPKNA